MRRLLVLIVVLLVYVCLYPWHFSTVPAGPFFAPLSIHSASAIKDFFLNFWVYVPFGAVLYWSFPGLGRVRAFLPFAAGFALSFLLEFLQAYIPFRMSSQADLLANTLGAVAGGLFATRWGSDSQISRWLPRRTPETFLLLVWLAFLTAPLIPVHGKFGLLQNLSHLRSAAFAWPELLLWTAASLTVWELIPGSLPEDLPESTRVLIFLAFLLLVPGRVLLALRTVTKAEVAGSLLALLAVTLCFGRMQTPRWILPVLWLGGIVVRGLAPFHLADHATPFVWVPFSPALTISDWQPALLVVLAKMFWYGCLVWTLGRALGRWSTAGISAVFVLGALEAIQMYLPPHVPEVTDPLMAAVFAAGFALAGKSSYRAEA